MAGDAPRPWRVDGGDVLADDGLGLFSKPFGMNELKWAKLAGRLVARANQNDVQVLGLPAVRGVVLGDLLGLVDEQDCPGHVASWASAKVCGLCGVHIDSLRPPWCEEEVPF